MSATPDLAPRPADGVADAPPKRAVVRPAMVLDSLAALVLIAALWFATRPYGGIVHDAQLYLAQALHRADPATYGSDIFFRYGSQDRYSLVSLAYAPAVRALGPGGAHLAFFLAASSLWLSAVYAFARSLSGSHRLALLGCITACTLLPTYTFGVLQYGEPFFTPRLLVEAAGMAALACICRGNRLAAFTLGAVALLLHPLLALPLLALLLVLSGPITRIFLPVSATGVLAALTLGLSGIDPFDRLFQSIDAEWLGLLEKWSQHSFVSYWGWQTLVICILPAVCLWLVARFGTHVQRRLAAGASVIAAAFVLTSWVMGDLFANLLITNLQLWRATWLFVLPAACLAPVALALLPATGAARPLFLAALTLNAIEARFGSGAIPFASASLALAALAALASARAQTPRLRRLACLGSSGLAAAATLLALAEVAGFVADRPTAVLKDSLTRSALVLCLALALVALVHGWQNTRRAALRRTALALVTAALAVASVSMADRRDGRMRLVTTAAPLDAGFLAALSDRSVYWENGLQIQWFRLRQPAYYSCIQSAGSMFFRQTAIELARRSAALSALNTADFPTDPEANCRPRANPAENGPTTVAQIETACRALPDLDAMVLNADLPDAPHLSWQPGYDLPVTTGAPKAAQDGPTGSYNLYLCADFRP